MITGIKFGGLTPVPKPEPIVAPLPIEYKQHEQITVVKNSAPKPVS